MRDDLGKRMKENYENISKTRLMRRTPVAIRIDGKAFHTFTRGFKKPFDDVLIKAMQDTTKYLCENIQGCVFGYTQSDEITLILQDYKTLTTSAWFDYEVQKVVSIAASMATMAFNKAFETEYVRWRNKLVDSDKDTQNLIHLRDAYTKAIEKGAMFDARCFNVPFEEVTNLVYWRQVDASRNSVSMVAQANFSHKELQNKSRNEMQDMLMVQKGINWNDYPTYQKRGSACIKETYMNNGTQRTKWKIDLDMPILSGKDREYLEKLVRCE